MTDNLAAMRTALRVLTAITNRAEPASTDVAELHRLATNRRAFPLDELACEVVQRIHQERASAELADERGLLASTALLTRAYTSTLYTLLVSHKTEHHYCVLAVNLVV